MVSVAHDIRVAQFVELHRRNRLYADEGLGGRFDELSHLFEGEQIVITGSEKGQQPQYQLTD